MRDFPEDPLFPTESEPGPRQGNACEHAAAIRFAAVDKVGLAVGIAVGSSVQIALFVTPFTVLMGWALGNDAEGHNMDSARARA